MSKVVGISYGRKMSNTEVMIKEALLECERAGHEIEFIRGDDLNIKPCTGCCSCVGGIMSGRSIGQCIHKDDFPVIEEAIYSSDALIIGSPVYETSPSGTFKILCDRIGPSHDISFLKTAYDERKAAGKTGKALPDERAFKKRVGALIAVGGARTENWTSMTLPVMYECMMSPGIDVIDHYVYYGAMNVEHVLGNPKVMNRMTLLGRHIIEALAAETEGDRLKWRGDSEGTCPVCHLNLLTMFPGTNKVECPVCGMEGSLDFEDGKPKVTFSEKEQARSRMKYAGKLEHSEEIKDGARTQRKVENLRLLKEKYLHVGEVF